MHNYQLIHRTEKKKHQTKRENCHPTSRAKAKYTKEPKEPNNKTTEIVASLEPTEYSDDQKPHNS